MAYPARAPAKNDAPTAAQYHRRTRKCRKRKDEPLCTTLRGYFDGLCRPRLRKEQGAHQEENRREGGVLWGDVAGILSLRAAKQRTCAKPTTHAEPQGKCSARERQIGRATCRERVESTAGGGSRDTKAERDTAT